MYLNNNIRKILKILEIEACPSCTEIHHFYSSRRLVSTAIVTRYRV